MQSVSLLTAGGTLHSEIFQMLTADENHRELLMQISRRNSGSESAMTLLYQALSGSVFSFVRRRLGRCDDHDVQAVVVDTMYEVWRAAPNYGGASLVKTWVLGIARHKLLDVVRRNAYDQTHVDIAEYADSLPDEHADVFDALVAKQQTQWLMSCMGKLPNEQRESLHLLLVEGLSIDAIAQVQGCPNGTVKTRVFHAKAKLKKCLAQYLDQTMLPSPS